MTSVGTFIPFGHASKPVKDGENIRFLVIVRECGVANRTILLKRV